VSLLRLLFSLHREFGNHPATARRAPETGSEFYEGVPGCPHAVQARLNLAALLLFQQAAREERLTVQRIQDFIHYLKKASANPLLRFKE
jgi:hypothetical protein